MPCSDYGERYDGDHEQARRLQTKCDVLTAMLCEAFQVWKGKAQISDELWEWWHDHEQQDKERGNE